MKLCLVLAFTALASTGCTFTRSQVRSALVVSAKGIVWANSLCAQAGKQALETTPTKALDGLHNCSKVTKSAFSALEKADDTLDAQGTENAVCAIFEAKEAMISMVSFVRSVGLSVSPRIIDAIEVASLVGAKCR